MPCTKLDFYPKTCRASFDKNEHPSEPINFIQRAGLCFARKDARNFLFNCGSAKVCKHRKNSLELNGWAMAAMSGE
jgi:hypothetical protein